VTIEKFKTNLVLVNMNKPKPYKYMEFEVQKKNNKCYIGKRVQVEFKRRILTHRRIMTNLKYKNHICRMMKIKNISQI
jgi:primosomal protein N'